ncbi:MAG TPA: hypothetical protein VFT43_04725, partial [Candidatus Polarisedimenticolia bacterium]|nr:hypothetical protein [Candidatus Polarisedimenticolia bacterium]
MGFLRGRLVPAALAVLLSLACGGAGARVERLLPGPAGRLNPIYDFTVSYPDTVLVIGGLSYRGLEIGLEIEFDDATLRDDDPALGAEARVEQVLAGG